MNKVLHITLVLVMVFATLAPSKALAQDPFIDERRQKITQQRKEIEDRRTQQEALQRDALFAIKELDVATTLIEDIDESLNQINTWIASTQTRLGTVQLSRTAAQKRVNEAQERAERLANEISAIRTQVQEQIVQIYLDLAYEPTFLLEDGDPNRSARRQFYIEELGADAQSLIDQLRKASDDQQLAIQQAEQAQLEIAQAQNQVQEALDKLNDLQAAQQKLQQEWNRQLEILTERVAQEAREQEEIAGSIARLDANIAAIEAEIAQEQDRRRLAELERQRLARLAELEAERQAKIAQLKERESRGEFNNPTFLQPIPGNVGSAFGNRIHPIFGVGRFHAGIDIAGNNGDPIRAAASGTVIEVVSQTGYGNTVVINHGEGWTTLYAHLSTFAVSTGQQVNVGDVIGAVGNTGWSTGPHLHFEIRYEGVAQNPVRYLLDA